MISRKIHPGNKKTPLLAEEETRIVWILLPSYFLSHGLLTIRDSPWGGVPFDCEGKRGSGFYRFRRFKGGATHKNQKRREVLKYTVLTKDEKPDEDSHKE